MAFSFSLFPLSNDFILLLACCGLGYFLYSEYFNPKTSTKKASRVSKIRTYSSRARPYLAPPYLSFSAPRVTLNLDMLSLQRYISKPTFQFSSVADETTRNSVVRKPRPVRVVVRTESSDTTAVSKAAGLDAPTQALCRKILFPFMPGCEPDGPNALELQAKFPTLTRPDIVRFLVARKGNLKAAEEMVVKYMAWRSKHFPLQKEVLRNAFATKCFFPYKCAKDGSPCVYMRGGLYDSSKATPEQFVFAAAYTIDWSLRQYPDQTSVTVIVHTVNVPGGANQGADMNFIKLFTQVLSDNYPERLKRLVLFPFPWYGRAIWGVAKVFVDKRTQDKVHLLVPPASSPLPPELLEYVDVNSMPEFVGGKCTEGIVDLLDTLNE